MLVLILIAVGFTIMVLKWIVPVIRMSVSFKHIVLIPLVRFVGFDPIKNIDENISGEVYAVYRGCDFEIYSERCFNENGQVRLSLLTYFK